MRQSNAPYWITALYGGKCFRCGRGVKKGETILYNASTKTFLCCYEPCGQRAQRELDRKAEDARRERPLYEYLAKLPLDT